MRFDTSQTSKGVYSEWDAIHARIGSHSSEMLGILLSLPAGRSYRVLDLACGTGGHLLEAARQLRGESTSQVPGAKLAVSHGNGGLLGGTHTGGTVILAAD